MADNAPHNASGRTANDAMAALAERWGAEVVDETGQGETGPEAAAGDLPPEQDDPGAGAEVEQEAQGEEPEGDVGSGENESEDGGEPAFSTLDDLLNAGGVSAEQLMVRVKGKGGEESIPLSEALSRTMFEADYRQKTSALSEERKAVEARQAEQLQAIQTLSANAQAVRAVLEETFSAQEKAVHQQFAGIDWNALLQQDRTEWMVAQQQYRNALEAVSTDKAQALGQLDAQVAQGANAAQAMTAEYLRGQRTRLAEMVPEWAEEGAFRDGVLGVQKYLVDSYGATEQEIRQLADARHWDLGRKGMRHDTWLKRAEAIGTSIDALLDAAEKAPRLAEQARAGTLRPGAASGLRPMTTAQKEERAARDKLRKSGRHDDAVAAMNARLASRGL